MLKPRSTPIVLFALAAAAVVATSAACGTAPAAPHAAGAGTPVSVDTLIVARVERATALDAGGTLHGRRSAVVSSRVMGTVVAVPVTPGDRVRAGQLLVQIDDAAMAADVRASAAGRQAAERNLDRARAEASAAAAAATLARATHDRVSALAQRRSATAQELDDASAARTAAEARVTAAEAAVAAAEAELARAVAGGDGAAAVAAWARVTAPFDGVVTEKIVEPGALVSPGSGLVRVEDTSVLELDVRLDDSRAAWARPGAAARVIVDADGAAVARDGRITEVGRAASVDSRAVLVTVALASGDGLRPGMFARASLPGPARAALVVPASAIIQRGQLTSVFVVEGAIARMRLVRLGPASEGDVEIIAGLADGDRVIVAPPASLRDGGAVDARTAPAATAGAGDAGGSR